MEETNDMTPQEKLDLSIKKLKRTYTKMGLLWMALVILVFVGFYRNFVHTQSLNTTETKINKLVDLMVVRAKNLDTLAQRAFKRGHIDSAYMCWGEAIGVLTLADTMQTIRNRTYDSVRKKFYSFIPK